MNAVNKSGLKTWTSYNSNEIQTIDKWCIFGGSDSNNRSVELGSGGCLLIYGTGSISAVYQKLESLDPGVYSLSAKIDDKIYKATLKWNNAYVEKEVDDGVYLMLSYYNDVPTFGIAVELAKKSRIVVEWAKLEKGSLATPYIARQYSEELLLCNNGIIGSNPNLLINGDFKVNQRGQQQYSNTSWNRFYCLDRWCIMAPSNAEGGTTTVSINDGGVIKITNTNTQGKNSHFRQYFEKVFSGEKCEYTASVNVLSVTGEVTLIMSSTEWANGKGTILRVGQNHNTYTSAEFFGLVLSAGASITIEWVKLEKGGIATPFVPRIYAEELAMCQRYTYLYSLTRWTNIGFYWYTVASNLFYWSIQPPVKMRTTPTVTRVSGNVGRKAKQDINHTAATYDISLEEGSAEMIKMKAVFGNNPETGVGVDYYSGDDGLVLLLDAEMY